MEDTELVALLDRKFAAVDEKFATFSEKFERMDERFREMAMKSERIEREVSSIRSGLHAVEYRLEKLHDEITLPSGSVSQRFSQMTEDSRRSKKRSKRVAGKHEFSSSN